MFIKKKKLEKLQSKCEEQNKKILDMKYRIKGFENRYVNDDQQIRELIEANKKLRIDNHDLLRMLYTISRDSEDVKRERMCYFGIQS